MPTLDELRIMETLRDDSETLPLMMDMLNDEQNLTCRDNRGEFSIAEVVAALRRLVRAGYVEVSDEAGLPLPDRDWANEPDLDTIWFELTSRGKLTELPSPSRPTT